jgi:hypothetical protein
MLANPDIGVTQIAHRLGVSPRDALSVHSHRTNREYDRRLRTPALTPEAEHAAGGFGGVIERRHWVDCGHVLRRNPGLKTGTNSRMSSQGAEPTATRARYSQRGRGLCRLSRLTYGHDRDCGWTTYGGSNWTLTFPAQ